ncbi:MAG TPA: MFS transporter [Stellaceae bacterium]|nr:MFS transporter [Stellaceae bacterium]
MSAGPLVAERSVEIGRTRWMILALLFFATTINYVDRQVIGILKPTLSQELGWSDIDYANIVFYFQLAYAIGYIGWGRIMDLIGVRRGYGMAVLLWSAAAALHGVARSAFGFGLARFALGLGEGGNFPACIKAVRAWFPASERALAAGIFNAGTNVGALITPFLVPWLTLTYGWPVAFYVTGGMGLIWLVAWWAFYQSPEKHGGVSAAEFDYIQSDQDEHAPAMSYRAVLGHRATWAYAAVQFLTSPVWWFYLFWLPDFLHRSHGLNLATLGAPLVVIYLLTDVGSILGGWLSSALITRGMAVLTARKVAMLICAFCVVPVVFAPQVEGLWSATLLVALAASAHQAWAANMFTLPSDTMPRSAVSSMAGFGGMVGAVGGMGIAQLAGYVLQTTGSYVVLFGMVPGAYFLALLLFHLLLPRGSVAAA